MFFRWCVMGLWLISAANRAYADPLLFHRGVNLSSWLANAPRQPLYDRDFAQIAQAGFDHVRLPVSPEALGFALESAAPADFGHVDAALALAAKHHLAVILDLHPHAPFMQALEEGGEAEKQFIVLWEQLARHYKSYSQPLAFELLNEPQYYHHENRYHALMHRLVAAIRQQDHTRLLIVAAPRGSSIEGLQLLDPINDPHIMYDVHFYEPPMITAQGSPMGFDKTMLRYFHDVPYPARRVGRDAAFYAPDAPNPAQAQQELQAYEKAGWDAERIAARIALIKAWADRHHARVLCGEFGALRTHIDADSRYRWIADVRQALDINGIGWDVWDYADRFGIAVPVGRTRTGPTDDSIRLADPEHGSRMIEAAALVALGLP